MSNSPQQSVLSPAANPLREGMTKRKSSEPCTIVVFGATGDLTSRKLIPALYNLSLAGFLPQPCAIVGVARRERPLEDYRADVAKDIHQFSRTKVENEEQLKEFLSHVSYHATTFDESAGYAGLKAHLDAIEKERGLPGNRLFYLATSPEYFTPITELLHQHKLLSQSPTAQPWGRIIYEKPFGHDLESARELNQFVQRFFHEKQIYRIDHYLGKETTQNILAFRFANAIFEPLWSNRYIEQVQITVSESLGMEGRRGQYYDTAGALRDMVQNHIFQLLCLTAMEAPASLDAESLRDEKVRLLRAIQPMTPAEVAANTVRGQYGPGTLGGQELNGYRQENLVNPQSITETYVALRLYVRNWRWAGVPFFVRTGKRLPKRASEIAVIFKQPPHQIFDLGANSLRHPNTLALRIQPDEGISLTFGAKQPGMITNLQDVKMDFRYGTSFGQATPEAYERLLLDGIIGDASLFTRSDEVDRAWEIISAIHRGWAEGPAPDFPNYNAGTWGPQRASELTKGLSSDWRKL
ncbi:MAG: glucose-6-phosphate dehydrogenase [Candidatus Sumerlaeia bacterium]|nr:glucose-6-phosphate dehydrogenase [Candidatus Sumerlaeia bacterium]